MDYSKLGLSNIEFEILQQYALLSKQLRDLDKEIQLINVGGPADGDDDGIGEEMLGNMRDLEKKLSVVYNIFKTSVYSLIMNNEEES